MTVFDTMNISVVICTRDRPELLDRCLHSLEGQLLPGDDLLVVASAPRDDKTQQIAAVHGARYATAHRPGLNIARNRALQLAQGDIIAYLDDDAVAAAGWLAALCDAFADETISCVTGRIRPLSLETAAQRHFETRFSFDRGAEPIRFAPDDNRPWYPIHPYHLGAGCNMAFRRQLFDQIGPFDEALDAGTATGGGGDLDIFRRLLQAGHTAVYAPQAVVFHEHRRHVSDIRSQFFAYGKSLTALMAKIWLEVPDFATQVPVILRQQLIMLVRQLVQQMLGRADDLPLHLTFLELLGNTVGAVAFVCARRRSVRQQLDDLPPAVVTIVSAAAPTALNVPADSDLYLLFTAHEVPVAAYWLPFPGTAFSAERLKALAQFVVPDREETEAISLEPGPTVSLVICTRDRPDHLHRCLSAISQMTLPPYELIIVNNGTSDEEVAGLAAKFGAQLLREPTPGLCRARNRGLLAAGGEIVAYVDDDVQVSAEWLAAITTVLSRGDIDAVVGPVWPKMLQTPAQRLFEAELGGLSRGARRRVYTGVADRHLAPQVGVGANLAVRRQRLLQVGGFDEALDPGTAVGAGGDIDLFYRLLCADAVIIYEPAAFVWHTHREDMSELRRLAAAYGRGTAAAYARWWTTGDWQAGRMLLGYWFRYLPRRFWRSWLGQGLLPTSLAWDSLRGGLAGPVTYWFSRQRVSRRGALLPKKQGEPIRETEVPVSGREVTLGR